MAEREGFEPPEDCSSTVFKTLLCNGIYHYTQLRANRFSGLYVLFCGVRVYRYPASRGVVDSNWTQNRSADPSTRLEGCELAPALTAGIDLGTDR
jgi:hypothetical protein